MEPNLNTGLVRNTLILAKFELKKLLFNPKGLIALIAFTLVWMLILLYPIRGASDILLSADFRQLIAGIFGESSVDKLFQWQVAEMAIFWVAALYLFPMFSIFVSADQFASDKSRGSFRFLILRTGRDSLFFGRFIGHMLIQSLLLMLTVAATILLALSRESSLLLPALGSGLMVFINIFIILLPYTALMALLSLYANSARQATIYAILFWAVSAIVIAIVNSQLPAVGELLSWILPGAQLSMMINTQGIASLIYAPIPLIQAGVLLFIGRSYMIRSSL
ncbi:ABC transporter permease subunit [Shewanella psychropiezotolerans]|uniref:ABC transporter permease subunit n=1 Tax=Shewanella psychropiezotolerans TaxID=2593655 RepID=A0ABX5X207_9GAMM|nr:ABC transporter permease subunit [Shewanella sp. YLB-07]QDO84487.1 ABC transporter permease subunit [Shewanella psychropiezotolerans]